METHSFTCNGLPFCSRSPRHHTQCSGRTLSESLAMGEGRIVRGRLQCRAVSWRGARLRPSGTGAGRPVLEKVSRSPPPWTRGNPSHDRRPRGSKHVAGRVMGAGGGATGGDFVSGPRRKTEDETQQKGVGDLPWTGWGLANAGMSHFPNHPSFYFQHFSPYRHVSE